MTEAERSFGSSGDRHDLHTLLSMTELTRTRPQEVRAIGDLAAEGVAGLIGMVQDLHRAIAERSFRGTAAGVGVTANPARLIHDAVSTGVYAGVSVAGGALLRVGGALASSRSPVAGPALTAGRKASVLAGALNGLIGDRMDEAESALALPMVLRSRGREVPATPEELAAAYPSARPRVVVFIHGLCETDGGWWRRTPAGSVESFGSRLERDGDWTAAYVRYNSGLHISENGRRLSALLADLVEAWPVEISEIALVGHSMGGLIARSASHQADRPNLDWRRRLGRLVCLGSPHLGAPLETGANRAAHTLERLAEARFVTTFLRTRSAGIKDLRHGFLSDDDWTDRDCDSIDPLDCAEVPLVADVRHYFVSATLARNPLSRLAQVPGDMLVGFRSAIGDADGPRAPLVPDDWRHFGGVNHFQLLTHPAVGDQVIAWLAADAPALTSG